MQPVIVTTGGRQPFEVAVLLAVLVCGIVLTVTGARPASVAVGMPATVQAIWEVGLILAGGVGLLGVFWPGTLVTSLGDAWCVVSVLGTVTTMYAIAMYAINGMAAIAAGAFVLGIAVASWWRAGQIGIDQYRIASGYFEQSRDAP